MKLTDKEIFILSSQETRKEYPVGVDSYPIAESVGYQMGFIFGYKACQENNPYDLEDIKKAIEYGMRYREMDEGKIPCLNEEEFIKSLK